jgi:hypothetical protein
MRRFVEEADRGQWTLLPECLDDFIDESNPVRVIDVFVDALDLAEMRRCGACGDRAAVVPSLGSPEAVDLWLPHGIGGHGPAPSRGQPIANCTSLLPLSLSGSRQKSNQAICFARSIVNAATRSRWGSNPNRDVM